MTGLVTASIIQARMSADQTEVHILFEATDGKAADIALSPDALLRLIQGLAWLGALTDPAKEN